MINGAMFPAAPARVWKYTKGKINRNHGCLNSAHSSSESGDLQSGQKKKYFCEWIIQCFVTSFQPRVNSWVVPGDRWSQISCLGGGQREKVPREMMSKWAELLPQLSDERIIRERSVRLRRKPMKPLTKVNTGSDKKFKRAITRLLEVRCKTAS